MNTATARAARREPVPVPGRRRSFIERKLVDWVMDKLESRIQTLITGRILKFHNAMLERGQIQHQPDPVEYPEDVQAD